MPRKPSVSLHSLFSRADRILSFPATSCVLLIFVAVAYSLAYFSHPNCPGNSLKYPEGWIGWWDQSKYYSSSWALSTFSLSAESYWYSLGYSALGAPFARLTHQHLFFVPNLACTLLSVIWLYKITCRLVSRLEAVLLLLAFVCTHQWLITETQVVPWSTIATQCIFLGSTLLVLTRKDFRTVIYLSLISGVTYVIRPADAICLAPFLIYSTLRLPSWRLRLSAGAAGIAIITAAVCFIVFINIRIFDSWKTPYDKISQEIGFFALPFSFKSYWLLIDGMTFYGESAPALILRFPWLLLAPATAVFWIIKERVPALSTIATAIGSLLFYLNYNDFSPSNIYRFMLIHYLTWWMILLFPLTYAAVTRGWKSLWFRASLLSVPLLLTLTLCLTLELRALPSSIPLVPSIHTITFSPPSNQPLVLQYQASASAFTPTSVMREGKPLRRYADYNLPYDPARSLISFTSFSSTAQVEVQFATSVTVQNPTLCSLQWSWHFMPLRFPLLSPALNLLSTATAFPNLTKLDLIGPDHHPDNTPDAIISVRSQSWILSQVREWDIETLDQAGHWTSAANPHGWWPVLAVAAPPPPRIRHTLSSLHGIIGLHHGTRGTYYRPRH